MLRIATWGICIFIVLMMGLTLYSRLSLYDYDVAANYDYDFSGKNAVITPVEIVDDRISLPVLQSVSRTSLLKVNVSSSLLGYMFQPSVEITSESGSETQFFEHGVEGVRYLNITNILSSNVTTLSFRGDHSALEDGTAEIIQFDNPIIDGKRILILAPHPDDAEIAAYGFYSSHDDVYVATITAGDAGPFMYDEIYAQYEAKDHYLKKGEVRTWNSLVVPLLGGVLPQRIVNLGYNDAQLRAMYRDKSYIAKGIYTGVSDMNTFRKQNTADLASGLVGINNWESLVGNLVYLINEINPDIIITPSPMLDQHSDHAYTTIAAFDALKQLDRRTGELLLYTNHQIEFNESFPYGDAGSVISLPPTPLGSNYFRSVYSFPMTLDQQRDKIFALDAMNDLRHGTDYRFLGRSIRQLIDRIIVQIKGEDESYFRRAIRSNEFFFVVDVEDIYDDEKISKL